MTALAFGTIQFTRHYDPEADPATWVTIEHADPRILVSHELLEAIQRGECEPHARIGGVCDTDCWPGFWRPCYQGARLVITASNMHLVYVIGKPRIPHEWCWEAEWPD